MTPTLCPSHLLDADAGVPCLYGFVRAHGRAVCWLRVTERAVSVIWSEFADESDRLSALALIEANARGRAVTIDGEQP